MTTITTPGSADRIDVVERAFVHASPNGTVDGAADRGIYASDVRVLRRVEAYRAEPEIAVPGEVVVGATGAVARFRLDAVAPGAAVLLVVEADGTDLFGVREELMGARIAGLGLAAGRGDARVRLEASCHGDASLEHIDGVALSDNPVVLDGTPRTASWLWRVPTTKPGAVDLVLELRASWTHAAGEHPAPPVGFAAIETAARAPRLAWLRGRPTVDGHAEIAGIVARSVEDLATLRIPTDDGAVLAAGAPWFLTVMGRDALLAASMALPIDPEIALATLRYLARHQSTGYDLAVDAEPGKIMHEERHGLAAERWHERYYGSADATPLFVLGVEETRHWCGDNMLARELETSIRAALRWIEARIEEDDLGLVNYWRRSDRGLDVQSWKDSPDSMVDRAGEPASGLIRPLEVQAYAIAALRAGAAMADEVWHDGECAMRWRAAAEALHTTMLDRFRVELPQSQLLEHDPRAGGYLAQAIDSSGLPVDSLASNIGHLLWADTLHGADAAEVVRQLQSDTLWSGWGVRTLASFEMGYDSVSYHRGSVWPHDTALCVAGMVRHDPAGAAVLALGMFEAARAHDGHLPELFAGDQRDPTNADAPRAIPTACTPQAWAAGAPLLMLRAVLGLVPDPAQGRLTSSVTDAPGWLHGLTWRGVYALGTRWDIRVDSSGAVRVVPGV